ncbi:MAG: hypothetical protein BECKG1743D_GA0114223_110555 [Candidatus Kentron sp. G]|nr:MAG: hypothetical protein BECKG1743D_GA0114223_110555 [Candidatus Kentron sp. G]
MGSAAESNAQYLAWRRWTDVSIGHARGMGAGLELLRPSKFEGHRPTIRHGCRMALMVALNWSVECVKEES